MSAQKTNRGWPGTWRASPGLWPPILPPSLLCDLWNLMCFRWDTRLKTEIYPSPVYTQWLLSEICFFIAKLYGRFLPIYVVSCFLPSEVILTWPYWACGMGEAMILLWWPFVVFSSCRKNLSLLLISFPKCFNSVPKDFKVNPRTVTSIGPCTSTANQIPPNHKQKMRSV